MEQPKKPAGGKDIADLKARLGLIKGPAPTPGPAPFPGAAPLGVGSPSAPAAGFAPLAPPPRAHDPFAAMRPPPGKTFDLRPVNDGIAAENVRARGGKAGLVIGLVVLVIGGAVGYGFGAAAVGRRAFNQANAAARRLKSDVQEIQKIVTQIGTPVSLSQQRLAAGRMDLLSYDPQLIDDLEKVKLDPRPDTSRVFKVDYFRLEDLAVDRLMTYYYDTIALYGEVERHIKRTRADRQVLEAVAQKQVASVGIYGVVFDQRGKLAIGTLVEVGATVCKGGGAECGADQIEGFQIRSNTGAPWSNRKIGPKPAGDIVVPLDKTPLFDAVMSGSPDQVRMEQYKQRYASIRLILARLAAEHKQLAEALEKAASRPDLFTL